MDWLPIETAPRDGTPILVYFPPHQYGPSSMVVVEYRAAEPAANSWPGVPERWASVWGEEGHDECPIDCPTHWMPLPDPPK